MKLNACPSWPISSAPVLSARTWKSPVRTRFAASARRAIGWNTSMFSRNSAATTSIIITKNPMPSSSRSFWMRPSRSVSIWRTSTSTFETKFGIVVRNSARAASSSTAWRASGAMRDSQSMTMPE